MKIPQSVPEEVASEAPIPRPSLKERQWQLREGAILDAAAQLLNQKGFNSMTLEDITEAIGISRPTLYLHFKSKEDIVSKLVIRNFSEMTSIINGLDPKLTPGERLRRFVHHMMEWRFEKSSVAMFDMMCIKINCGTDSPELRQAEQNFIGVIEKLVLDAQMSGEIWRGLCPEMFVLVLGGFVKNLEIDSLLEEGKATVEEIENAILTLIFDRA